MDKIWHLHIPFCSTRCTNAKQLAQKAAELNLRSKDKSFYVTLEKNQDGSYHLETKKVGLWQRLTSSSAERKLQTQRAIAQFVEDNRDLFAAEDAANLAELQSLARPASTLCSSEEAFKTTLNEIEGGLDSTKYVIELEYDGSKYTVKKKEVGLWGRLFGSAEKRTVNTQAAIAKFMHDNAQFAKTANKANKTFIQVLGLAIDARQQDLSAANQNSQNPLQIEIAEWSQWKIAGEKDLADSLQLDIKKQELQEKSQLIAKDAVFQQQRTILFLEPATDEARATAMQQLEAAFTQGNSEAGYLLALSRAKAGDTLGTLLTSFQQIKLKGYRDSWIAKHVERILEELQPTLAHAGKQFCYMPLERARERPIVRIDVTITGFNADRSLVTQVRTEKS